MKVVIVHGSNLRELEKLEEGWPQQNERNWIPWIREELKSRVVECITPLMPESWAPVYEKWKKEFEKIKINEEDILVGTSAGGAFLVQWLIDTNKKIKKLILVAPAKVSENPLYLSLYGFKFQKNILENVKKIVLIESDNDGENILKAGKIYSKELRVEPIVLKGKGHFLEKQMGTKEFPELLEKILE